MTPVALFLAMLLAGSVAHKVSASERLSAVAGRLAGLHSQGLTLLVAAGALEAVAAACLVVPMLRQTGALIAMAVWLAYALALLLRRGETLDCGCDLIAREKPVGWPVIARPSMLALVAAVVSTLPAAPIGLDGAFAAAGLLALYLAASELLAIPHPRWRKH
ncbi:MAG: MauE/DoxX family redox-associated membrane protein [Novosphingobium sp.]